MKIVTSFIGLLHLVVWNGEASGINDQQLKCGRFRMKQLCVENVLMQLLALFSIIGPNCAITTLNKHSALSVQMLTLIIFMLKIFQ